MKKSITQSSYKVASTFAADLMASELSKEQIKAEMKVLVVSYFTGHKKSVINQIELIFQGLYIDQPEGMNNVLFEKLRARQLASRRTFITQFNHTLTAATQDTMTAIVDGVAFKASAKETWKLAMDTTANNHGRVIKAVISKIIPKVAGDNGDVTNTQLDKDKDEASNNASGSGNSITTGDDKNRSDNAERDNALSMAQSVEAFEAFLDLLDPAVKITYKDMMVASCRRDKRQAKQAAEQAAEQAAKQAGMETASTDGVLELS